MKTTDSPLHSCNMQFSFSFFNNLWSKDSTVITLHELYQQETSSLWKSKTESYRKLKGCPGRENDAKKTKGSMPAVVIEGICRPHCSHAAANLEKMNGLAMYDLDHCDQRTPEIKNLLCRLPYVTYMHKSISGEGLKVIVYLDVNTPGEYPLAYAICRQTLERIAGHPCDGQCARITQPCSCVWDPDAYYNPAPELYPWREELATDPSLRQLVNAPFNAGNAAVSTDSIPFDADNAPFNEGNTAANVGNVPSNTGNAPFNTGNAPSNTGNAPFNTGNAPSNTGNGRFSPIPPPTEAYGYIETFIHTFFQYHPWQKGNRHESMLALGRSARRKGFSKEELEKLTSVMSAQIVGNGYTLQELQKDLSAGYQYVNLSYDLQNAANPLTRLTTDTSVPVSRENLPEEEEDLSIKNEEIRGSSPYIPEGIFPHLPNFLTEALRPARNKREQDILLLGILINLSGCLPKVRIIFDQRPFSPHLYLLVIAPPASGKGLLSLAGMLPEGINNYLKEENKRKKEAYEHELRIWEENHRQYSGKGYSRKGQYPPKRQSSGKEQHPENGQYLGNEQYTEKDQYTGNEQQLDKDQYSGNGQQPGKDQYTGNERQPDKDQYSGNERQPDKDRYSGNRWQPAQGEQPVNPSSDSMPEEPEYHYLCGAPNTSKNQIINRLKINADLGLIINATELDMISGAMKQDYGKHDDVFRAAFQHEPAATDYKTDRQIICAETPRLALCLSGTPNQLPAFIRSTDNGLYGRFLIYTCAAQWKYRSAAPIKGQEDYITLYKRLNRQVLDMFLFFRESPTEVKLTDRQWKEHTSYFDLLLNEVTSEQANAPGDIVLRASLMAVRIAAILTSVRKFESGIQMNEYTCTDEDFHTAMQIVHATVTHSLLLSSSLLKDEIKPKPLKLYFQIRSVINELPATFTYKEVKEKALTKGICERSTCRYLKRFTELNYLENQGGVYKKIKKITDKQA